MSIILKVVRADSSVAAVAQGESEVHLVYDHIYREGDSLTVECAGDQSLFLQLEDTIPPALVYLKGASYSFPIPFGEKKIPYSPRSFAGERHLLWARASSREEALQRRNLAYNPLDCHENTTLFPHAGANVETRGEAVFAARNAIDGVKAGSGHGEWPYTSWGINRDPQARLRLDFGRRVLVDQVNLYLRADFPHDAWWEACTLTFSDGSVHTASLKKTGDGQPIPLAPLYTEWVELGSLIKADDPSPFPALTQIEVYGTDI